MKIKLKNIIQNIFIAIFIIFIFIATLINKITYKPKRVSNIKNTKFKNNKYGLYLLNQYANKHEDYKTLSNFYSEAIKQNNNNDFLNKVFILEVINGKTDELLKQAENDYKKDKKYIIQAMYLIKNYFINKEYNKSFKILNEMKQNNAFTIFFKAWNLAALKKYDNALDLLENNLDKFSSEYRKYTLMYMGIIAELAKDIELANECYTEVLDTEKPNIYDIENIISFYTRQNKIKKALEIIENYYEKNPDSLAIYSLLDNFKNKKYTPSVINTVNKGFAKTIFDISAIINNLFLDTKQNYLHIANLSLIEKLDPNLYMSDLLKAELYKTISNEIFIKTLDNIPDKHYLGMLARYNKIQNLLFNQKTKNIGLKLYTELLDKYPNIPILYLNLGNFYKTNKESDLAIINYDKALKYTKNKALMSMIYFNKAQIYDNNKDIKLTHKNLEASFNLYNKNPVFLNYYGYFLIENDIDINKGLDLINKAISKDPLNGNFWDSFGFGLYKNKDYKRAIKILEFAKNLNPKDPTITEHLADTYWKIGRTREAIFEWEKILKMPNLDDYKEIINIEKIKYKINNGIK